MGKNKTVTNHYVSKFIMRRFRPKGCNLYELDCATKNIVPKSIDSLFSGNYLWSQKLEDIIDRDFENWMALAINDIQCVVNWRNDITYFLELITDERKRKLYNTFIMQTMLFQKSMGEDIPDGILEKVYQDKLSKAFPVVYIRVNPLISKDCPLLLIDNMIFTDVVLDETKKTLGSVVFSYPISPSEMIFVGPVKHSERFLAKFSHPHFINICSILLHKKKCKIASANLQYLEYLKKNLDSFELPNNAPYQITAIR